MMNVLKLYRMASTHQSSSYLSPNDGRKHNLLPLKMVVQFDELQQITWTGHYRSTSMNDTSETFATHNAFTYLLVLTSYKPSRIPATWD